MAYDAGALGQWFNTSVQEIHDEYRTNRWHRVQADNKMYKGT